MSSPTSPDAPTVANDVVAPRSPGWRSRWRALARAPRSRWINIGLAITLVGALAAAYFTIGNPSTPTPVERTATVTRGDVTAKATASGNSESQLATPVSFQNQGTLTAVDVKAGDTVTLGQVLATIDPTTAKEGLRTARASLAGAQAAYDQARSGPTDVQRQQDQAATDQAQQGVDNAGAGVDNARDQRDLDEKAQASAVQNAQNQLSTDQSSADTTVKQAQAQLAADTVAQNTLVTNAQSDTACSATTGSSSTAGTATPTPVPTAGCTSNRQQLTQAQQTRDSVLDQDRLAVTAAQQAQNTTLDKDRQAITAAQQSQSDTLLKDDQTIRSAKQAVHDRAGAGHERPAHRRGRPAPADPRPDRPGPGQRRLGAGAGRLGPGALDETTLNAPQAGVVLTVNGKVGESSGSGSTRPSGNGTAFGTGSVRATRRSAPRRPRPTSAGNGFITIANPSQLAVTANIAEADATNIQLGQPATITFPATNSTTTGSVTEITPQSTVTNNVVLYPIKVALDAAPPGVGVGATASLSSPPAPRPTCCRHRTRRSPRSATTTRSRCAATAPTRSCRCRSAWSATPDRDHRAA